MSVYSITNRYAKALLRQAEETNQFEPVANDMLQIYETLESSKELRIALESPVINEEKKNIILKEIFGSLICKETANFLEFLIRKNREDLLFEISKHFLEMKDEKLNIVHATVTSAIDLSDTEKDLFKNKLEEYSNKNVRLDFKIDSGIIGGFVVRMKDKMLDASIIHQLDVLRKRLIKADQSLVN